MAREVELKCLVSRQGLNVLKAWFGERDVQDNQQVHLMNRYFDTPDHQLQHHKMALRIREKQGRFYQTLKTQGTSTGGLHQRGEWEWPIDEPALNLDLLKETPFPLTLGRDKLVPLFETNFHRQQITMEVGGSVIEVALDDGEVMASGKTMPIREVEIELMSGPVDGLFSLAEEMIRHVSCQVSDLSKGVRGYYLSGIFNPPLPANCQASLYSNELSGPDRWHRALHVWIQSVDYCYLTGNAHYLKAAVEALSALAQWLVVERPVCEWIQAEKGRLQSLCDGSVLAPYSEALAEGSRESASAALWLLKRSGK